MARGGKMAFIGTLQAGIPPNIAAVPPISHLEWLWIGSWPCMRYCATMGDVAWPRGRRNLPTEVGDPIPLPAVGDTNPKRQRGLKPSPRLRFGLVCDVLLLTAGSNNSTDHS
jgi:hypothetical protein